MLLIHADLYKFFGTVIRKRNLQSLFGFLSLRYWRTLTGWLIFVVSWFLTLGLCCRPISVEGELVELVMARFIGWLLDHFSSSLTNTRVPLYWGYHWGCKCFRSAVLNLRPLMIPKVCCSLSLFSSFHLGFDNLLYSHWSDSSLIRKKEDFFSLCIDMPNKGFHLVFGRMM